MSSLILGDCVDMMAAMPAESIDAIVTDPPYGLEFMGKDWDRLGDIGKTSHAGPSAEAGGERGQYGKIALSGSSNKKCRACGKWEWTSSDRKCVCAVPDFPNVNAHQARIMQEWHERWASEALRVLKPGGHLLAFGGTRTHHRLMVAVEDAGFVIRDTLCWLYGSGFPKSLDVGKALDKAAGAEREVVGRADGAGSSNTASLGRFEPEYDATIPSTDAAREWEGWGTALKPAWEPIVLARKPLVGTVAQNVLEHGTGALNIDGTRIATGDDLNGGAYSESRKTPDPSSYGLGRSDDVYEQPSGRWPANVVLDDEAAALLDAQAGDSAHSFRTSRDHQGGLLDWQAGNGLGYADSGGPSRFYYTAKASRGEREAGLLGYRACTTCGGWLSETHEVGERTVKCRRNSHPTVKPLALMRWLVRMVTPPAGRVLDPFLGSGTTGAAAALEGFDLTGIEQDPDSLATARLRIAHWAAS